MIEVCIIDSLSFKFVESSNLHTNTSISSKLMNKDVKIQKFVDRMRNLLMHMPLNFMETRFGYTTPIPKISWFITTQSSLIVKSPFYHGKGFAHRVMDYQNLVSNLINIMLDAIYVNRTTLLIYIKIQTRR